MRVSIDQTRHKINLTFSEIKRLSNSFLNPYDKNQIAQITIMKRPYEESKNEIQNCLQIKYARSPDGPMIAQNDRDKVYYGELECYVCDEPLSYRRNHNRHKNGISIDVRACFTHHGSTGCKKGENGNYNETCYHLSAKDCIAKNKKNIQFITVCALCRKKFNVDFRQGSIQAIIEYKWLDFVLDVAFIDSNNELVGAVEVFYSHEISKEKREALSVNGIAWIEVSALVVLETLDTEKEVYEVEIMDCAMSKRRCWECVLNCDKEEEKMRNALKERYLLSNKASNPHVTLNFGKYKGLKFEDIWEERPDYIRWLSGYTGYRSGCKPIINEVPSCIPIDIIILARQKMKSRCLLCFEPLQYKETWKTWCPDCYREALDT